MLNWLAAAAGLCGLWFAQWQTGEYCASWLLAFVLTQAIEAPIYRRFCLPPNDAPTLQRWWPALLPSAVTHPLLWFALPAFWAHFGDDVVLWAGPWLAPPEMQDSVVVNAAETLIWLGEGALLHAQGGRRGWLWAAAGNLASYAFGLLLSKTIGWP